MGRRWRTCELDRLRRDYRALGAARLGLRLGRTKTAVSQMAVKIKIARRARRARKINRRRLSALVELGLPDIDIARRLCCDPKTVGAHRRALGLSSNQHGAIVRAKIARGVRRQCTRLGLSGMSGHLRSLAWRVRSARVGWPALALCARDLAILSALEQAPKTHAELSTVLDVRRPWASLSRLIERGLIVRLGARRGYALAAARGERRA